MNLLINTSTLSSTGPSQVAVSFINECINFPNNIYHILLSRTVEEEISKENFPPNFTFYSIPAHPLYGIKGFYIRKKIRRIEKLIKPDCVFSVFGPSCWTPSVPHLMGYAYPHHVYPDSPLFSKLTKIEKLKISLMRELHFYFLRRNGKFYVSETQDVSGRLVRFFNFDQKKVFTVSNTYNNYFNESVSLEPELLPQKANSEFRFLSLCSFAQHKNLEILNKVIPELNQLIPNNSIKFVLTVDPDSYQQKFTEEVKNSIVNLGRIPVAKCPQLYSECDALFLPTTLECFSANYPEAMKMERPILTSNLSFATSVCGDAAMFFDPYDAHKIASAIKQLTQSEELREKLIKNGKKQLKLFLSPKKRAEEYLNICENIKDVKFLS